MKPLAFCLTTIGTLPFVVLAAHINHPGVSFTVLTIVIFVWLFTQFLIDSSGKEAK